MKGRGVFGSEEVQISAGVNYKKAPLEGQWEGLENLDFRSRHSYE